MTHDQDSLIRELDALLDLEREMLLKGNLEALTDIVEQKESLIDALNTLEIGSEKEVYPVNEKVVRNQALLEQALKGIRSVARRLADIRQTRKTFDTYDQMGQKNRIEQDAKSTVEKRA